MDTSNFNDGIRAQAGVGTRVRNIGGKLIYEAIQQPFAPPQYVEPHPLKIIPAASKIVDGETVNGTFLRVINGRIGGKLADGAMGTEPFMITESDDTPFSDLDFIYSKIPMAWDDANEWCLPTSDGTILYAAAVPVPDDDWSYCQLGRIGVEGEGDERELTVIEQNAAGNLALVRSGVVGNIVDKYFLGI